jgi:hypothetical protein
MTFLNPLLLLAGLFVPFHNAGSTRIGAWPAPITNSCKSSDKKKGS